MCRNVLEPWPPFLSFWQNHGKHLSSRFVKCWNSEHPGFVLFSMVPDRKKKKAILTALDVKWVLRKYSLVFPLWKSTTAEKVARVEYRNFFVLPRYEISSANQSYQYLEVLVEEMEILFNTPQVKCFRRKFCDLHILAPNRSSWD